MREILTPDICVIGAGAGGLTLAAGAVAFGMDVVLIEKNAMGGDCLYYGCVPSKALISAAGHFHALHNHSERPTPRPRADFGAVRTHIADSILAVSPQDSEERFIDLGVHVIKDVAHFEDERTVRAGNVTIKPRRIVIATGLRPNVPDIPGLETIPYHTNETIFSLEDLPSHLLIIGGGAMCLELAQAYRRLGAEVTILARSNILRSFEPDAAELMRSQLQTDEIALHEGAKIHRVGEHGNALEIEFETQGKQQNIQFSHLLLATGRRADLKELGLDKAGIAHDASGILVDRKFRTNRKHIYAVGDVAAIEGITPIHATHAANHHAGLVLRSILFRVGQKLRPERIPRTLFTDPAVATVGLSESEAKAQGLKYSIIKLGFDDNDRAKTDGRLSGFIRVVAGRRGRILGVTIAGQAAEELIHIWALAIAKGLTFADMSSYVAPYPTRGEISNRAALTYFQPLTRHPMLRKLLGVLHYFG